MYYKTDNNPRIYNYEEFEKFLEDHDGDGYQYDLVNGVIHMYASPAKIHQRIGWFLTTKIGDYLEGKLCNGYYEYDVYLSKKSDRDFIRVKPDIIVVCDKDKEDNNGIMGAPDWIIEIISPSSLFKDYNRNYHLYLKYGVREYWIVNPDSQTITVFQFEYGTLKSEYNYSFKDAVKVSIFDDLRIDFSKFDV